jgi:hypothetical protein
MSYVVVIRFEGVSEADYWSVNDKLGIKRDGSGPWPKGIIAHTAGATPDGWVVVERWASKADHESFLHNALGAALAAAGLPDPAQIIEFDTVNEKFLS